MQNLPERGSIYKHMHNYRFQNSSLKTDRKKDQKNGKNTQD